MNNENLNATLRCVTRPSAAQEEKIKQINSLQICKQFVMAC